MKMLVTGGNGFIGNYLVEALIELGHEIVILSNEENDKNPKVTFIKGDIRDAYDVRNAMDGCGLVYHLAALSDLRNANDDDVYAVNFLGSKKLLFEFTPDNPLARIYSGCRSGFSLPEVGASRRHVRLKPYPQGAIWLMDYLGLTL